MPARTVPIVIADTRKQRGSSSEETPGPSPEQIHNIHSSFHRRCHKISCQASLVIDDYPEYVDLWSADAQQIPPASQLSAIKCHACYEMTCAGCGSVPTLGPDNIFTTVGVVNSCCPQGRLFSIWLLLCNIDARRIKSRKHSEEQKPSKRSKLAPHHSSTGPQPNASGVGYSGGWDVFDHHPHHNNNAPSVVLIDPEEEKPDDRFTGELKILTALIPRFESEEDKTFLSETLCLFRHSVVFDHLAELLRNDSIADMVERHLLYFAVFDFLEAIGDHPFLRQLLLEERFNRKDSPGLHALSLDPSSHTSDLSQDRLSSVISNGGNLFRQTEWFLNMIEKQDNCSGSHRESVRLCKIVVKVFQKMQHHVSSLEAECENDSNNDWMRFCVENRVTFSDDVLNLHKYENDFSNIKTSSKGRLTTIGKEIANMMTSLPAGVFLKVAESRSDVMKVLIVGVEGSPYAGGLFTFDMFLDAKYPVTPPKMHFTSEGNNSENWSFNPNLHKDTGTVCLSLINTWQGSAQEMWQPGKSTILAVLISVQAMILGAPIPWINEPGYSSQVQTQEAHQHKLLIQYKTARYAMAGWLGKTIDPKYVVWDAIRNEYWKHNGLSAFMTVKEWSKDNSLIASGSPSKSSKTIKRFNTPTLPKEDLRVKLAELLDLTAYLDPPSLEDDSTDGGDSSNKNKSKAKGNKKRKAEAISNRPEDEVWDDAEVLNHPEETLTLSTASDIVTSKKLKKAATATLSNNKSKAKAQLEHTDWQDNEDEGPVWIYNGPKTQKETRAACGDFGITGAKSIKDTITKLEHFVNDNDLGEHMNGMKWGHFI